jgi:hypothetical protein
MVEEFIKGRVMGTKEDVKMIANLGEPMRL